jgi:hypothetical protein
MRKLELKDIVGYLPYTLKMLCDCNGNQCEWVGSNNKTKDSSTWILAHPFTYEKLELFKPILRPLSDLIKPCLTNGDVPIVELAKLAGCSTDRKYKVPYKKTVQIGDGISDNYCVCFIKDKDIITFQYTNDYGFECIDDTDISSVGNQVALFDKLNEWHFDYRGLIEAELAIDINTLIILENDNK